MCTALHPTELEKEIHNWMGPSTLEGEHCPCPFVSREVANYVRICFPANSSEFCKIKVAQRCCGAPACLGKNLVRNTQIRQKNRAQRCVTKPFLVISVAKIVRNMNRSCYACATLKGLSYQQK